MTCRSLGHRTRADPTPAPRSSRPAARRCSPSDPPTTAPAAATGSSIASSPSCSASSASAERTIAVAPVGCSVFAYDYIRRRLGRGAPRPRAGRRDRRPAGAARRVRPHLPGRRRPRRDRHRRDRPCRGARRAHHRDLRQQRDLRDDRRPDGPDHAARPEDHLVAARPRVRLRGLSRSRSPRCWRSCPGVAYAARGHARRRRLDRQGQGDDQAGDARSSSRTAASRSSRSSPTARWAGA